MSKKIKLHREDIYILNSLLNDSDFKTKKIKDLIVKIDGKKSIKSTIKIKEYNKVCKLLLENEDFVSAVAYLDDLSEKSISKINSIDNNRYGRQMLTKINCPQDIIEYYAGREDVWTQPLAIERTKNVTKLYQVAVIGSPLIKGSVLKNDLCDFKLFKHIVDNAKELEIMLYKDLIESPFVNPELVDVIARKSNYVIADIAKRKDLLEETIHYIVDLDSTDGTNACFAKAYLLSNTSIPEKYKKELLSNKQKHGLSKGILSMANKD